MYSNGEFTFDISNDVVKKEVLQSIKKQISIKNDLITEYSLKIKQIQEEYANLLKDTPTEIGDIVICKDDILIDYENDKKIRNLEIENEVLNKRIEYMETKNSSIRDVVKVRFNEIIGKLNYYYKLIDEIQIPVIEDLFTKNNENYSGSEEQIFYFSKLLSINKSIEIDFPIIVDCYRDGEISTIKEHAMLKEYLSLKKQVILTATLKDQEYSENQYGDFKSINTMDYSSITSNKLLSGNNAHEFISIVKKFGIEL